MAVTDLEQRSRRVNWDVERRAGNQLLVVEIASVYARRRAVHAAHALRRRDAHAAEEGLERNLDAVGEMTDHPLPVEADDLRAPLRKILGQKSAAPAKRIASIWQHEVDLPD